MNPLELHRAARRTSMRNAGLRVAGALLATVAIVLGCGGGGGGGGGGTSGTGGPSGAWFYDNHFGTATRFDLGTKAEVDATIAPPSNAALGYGGGTFTDVSVNTLVTPQEYRVNLRDVTPNPFALRSSLPAFTFTSGYVSGPVQRSPNGSLFTMHTRESASLSDPFLDYVYVFDASLQVTLKQVGYRAPAWLANDRIVVAGDDGLFTITVAAAPVIARLGPAGTAPADQPAVSPDGRSVAFLQSSILWRIGADGSGLAQLTAASATMQWPRWSPDGSQIALVSGVCGQFTGPDIVIVSASATNQNVAQAARVLRNNGAPARSCGPVYWLP